MNSNKKNKKNKQNPSQKDESIIFYESDLLKSLKKRMYEFYAMTNYIYGEKSKAVDSIIDDFYLALDLFHEYVKNLEPIILGITPFSFNKLNQQKYLKRFTRSEKHIAIKAWNSFLEAENLSRKEKELLQKSKAGISRFLGYLLQLIKDCTSIIKFCTDNTFTLLFLALEMCCCMNYKKDINAQ